MATVHTFRTTGDDHADEIIILTVQAGHVRIVPVDKRASDSAPSHRVLSGQAETGAASIKTSKGGRASFGLKLDDPSFANLVEGDDGEGYRLIWSRPNTRGKD